MPSGGTQLRRPGVIPRCGAQAWWTGVTLRALQGTSIICQTFTEHLLGCPGLHPGNPELNTRLPAFEDFPFQGEGEGEEDASTAAPVYHGFPPHQLHN